MTLGGTGGSSYTTSLNPAQYKMVGNPSGANSATAAANLIYTYDSATGYTLHQGSAILGVGQDALVYSAGGGTATVTVATPAPAG